MGAMTMKPGTKIEIAGLSFDMRPVWRPAVIAKAPRATKWKPGYPQGWHRVAWPDGTHSAVHESGFRMAG